MMVRDFGCEVEGRDAAALLLERFTGTDRMMVYNGELGGRWQRIYELHRLHHRSDRPPTRCPQIRSELFMPSNATADSDGPFPVLHFHRPWLP